MVTQTHEQELRELFDKLPAVTFNSEASSLNGEPVKMLTYSLLVAITETMMNKAYHYGKMEAMENMEQLIVSTFK